MPEPDPIARRSVELVRIGGALEKLWGEILSRHPRLPASAGLLLLPLPEPHRGMFLPPGRVAIAESTVDEGPQQVLRTLLHEAAHLLLCVRGAKTLVKFDGTEGTRTYHNVLFRDAAVTLGLTPPERPDQHSGYAECELPKATLESYRDALGRYCEAIAAIYSE